MTQNQEKYDIVIVGAGPVGILLSLCMSRWGYKVKHIDNRPVPTATGRADGIQPRSIEILRNLGIKRKIMAYNPAKVYDVAFWDPLPNEQGINRTGSWPSCPRFIDTRYPFTALVHQGKIERAFLEEIEKAGTTVERPWTISGFKNDGADETYPVEVQLKSLDTNVIQNIRTKYLFSGEGARSFVREQLGIKIHHKDPISYVWGVMDGVVRTNFPDIEVSCFPQPMLEDIADCVRQNAQSTPMPDLSWLSPVKTTWSVSTSRSLRRQTPTGTPGRRHPSRKSRLPQKRFLSHTGWNGTVSNGTRSTQSARVSLRGTPWMSVSSWVVTPATPTAYVSILSPSCE